MVDDSDSEADATSGSTSMQPESILHNGAFFPSSQQFVVAGGTFTSVGNVNLTTPTPPPVFRTIPFGDLDLRSEIRLDSESGVVWKRDIARYSALRHPNFLQLYGISKSCPLYATVFHGDLMPVEHVVDMYRHSHILTTYIYACLDSEFLGAAMYFQHQVSGKYLARKLIRTNSALLTTQ
ncbi:hypothetical protein C8R44DRAFT_865786 [Mycena epipterygia]|nr:hypothetical protein C8R44DRAFT_865786 [Mycena epipterygia]